MAGAGYKLFSTGDVLSASDVNTYLQQQTVMVFASAAARTTALASVLAEGMVTYLKDTDVVEIYTGAAWVSLDDPNAIQNSIVDAKGDIISATADNTPARLAVGANNTVLTADSSTATGLKWATPATASSGLTFIKRSTFSAVTDTGSTLDGIFTSSYADYLVIFENFRCAAGTPTFQLRYMTSGSTKSSGYYGSIGYFTYTATQYLASNAATQFNISGLNSGSDNSGAITFQNITLASGNTVGWTINVQDGATDRYGAGGGLCAGNSFTGIILFPTSSTISGTVSVYGYAKA